MPSRCRDFETIRRRLAGFHEDTATGIVVRANLLLLGGLAMDGQSGCRRLCRQRVHSQGAFLVFGSYEGKSSLVCRIFGIDFIADHLSFAPIDAPLHNHRVGGGEKGSLWVCRVQYPRSFQRILCGNRKFCGRSSGCRVHRMNCVGCSRCGVPETVIACLEIGVQNERTNNPIDSRK